MTTYLGVLGRGQRLSDRHANKTTISSVAGISIELNALLSIFNFPIVQSLPLGKLLCRIFTMKAQHRQTDRYNQPVLNPSTWTSSAHVQDGSAGTDRVMTGHSGGI